MTDTPQWAMEKADEFGARLYGRHERGFVMWPLFGENGADLRNDIARALVEAEARGIERAAKVLEEGYEMDVAIPYYEDGNPSKHDKCSHDKYHWEDCEGCALAAIRKLMEQDNG